MPIIEWARKICAPRGARSESLFREAELFHHRLEIFPGLTLRLDLLRARAEQVRRMVRRHDRRLAFVQLPLAADLRDPELRAEQRADCGVAERDDRLRRHRRELLVE